MNTLNIRYDGGRQLRVKEDNTEEPYLLLATNESGSAGTNWQKRSKTWNFFDSEGRRVRIQIQEWNGKE